MRDHRPDRDRCERRRIGRHEALSPQRLPEQQEKQRRIACRGSQQCPDANGLRRAPPPQADRDERERLDRVQADEVRNAQIAVLPAPSRHRHAGTAVQTADRVRARSRHAPSGAGVRKLRRRWAGHQRAGQRADDGERHAETQGPSERPVGEPLPPQRDGDRHAHQRLQQDRAAHDEEQHRIERRRHVEMAGRSAPGLGVDDRDLQHEHDRGRPADDAADARPVRQPSEDPGEREAVDGGGDRELERLEPGGRAGDDARIDEHRHQRSARHDEHQRSHRRQRRARTPQASEQGGGSSPGSRPDGAWCRIHERLL